MTGRARPEWYRALAAWAGRLMDAGPRDPTGKRLRPARLRRYGDYTALQFARGQTQSRMRTTDPDHLLIDYTRSMLACLLWQPQPALVGMIGLGGGSQVKFCHRHLHATRIEVAENHPGVIAMRRAFDIPDDDARLEVLLADGARFLQARRGRFDLLLVDGYDETGIPEALSSQAFYDACRDALAPGGAMACNLYCADAEQHLSRLRGSFGPRVQVVEEATMSNRVAFAWAVDAGIPGADVVVRVLDALPPEGREQLAPALARVASALSATGARHDS